MAEKIYNVLWVDDDLSIVRSLKTQAEKLNLKLIHFTNWNEAEVYIKENFYNISAIILDAHCKLKEREEENNYFLGDVVKVHLITLFKEKGHKIPWFILTAGTMDGFKHAVQDVRRYHETSVWGEMLYYKDGDKNDISQKEHLTSSLLKNILTIAENPEKNIILLLHEDTLQYVGEGKIIDYPEAKNKLIYILESIYFPEKHLKFKQNPNELRKILEYIFRAARQKRLIANDFFKGDNVILSPCSKFLCGKTFEFNDKKWKGINVFSGKTAEIEFSLFNYVNENSHTSDNISNEDKEYLKNKDVFKSIVYQTCFLIQVFAKYVEKHEHSEIKSYSTIRNSKETIKGKTYLVKLINGVRKCGEYSKLDENIKLKSMAFKVISIIDNEGEDKMEYPYIITEIEDVI